MLGLGCVQFNFECAGLSSMPEAVPPSTLSAIASASRETGVRLAALSATFNMAHPDGQRRELGVRRLRVVAQAAAGLGVPLLTLCSGTRDRENMWREHPDNRSRQAWKDLLETMEKGLAVAADNGVDLAIEPEPANVVSDAGRARVPLDTLQAGHLLRIIVDPANLSGEPGALMKAFDLLGLDIALAHAKDRQSDGKACALGRGLVDSMPILGCCEEPDTGDLSSCTGSTSPKHRNRLLSFAANFKRWRQMPFIETGGIRYHYALSGSHGPLVVFQHGLGGDVSQPQGILGNSTVLRAFSFDCRGHGRTKPMGPPESLRFSAFADDLWSILNALRIEAVVAGGISMGAGLALNFALRYPSYVKGLIISRPAWLDAPSPSNLEILQKLARWLEEHGPEKSRALLMADPEFVRIRSVSRESSVSILRQLERPHLEEAIATLAQLPADAPCPAPEGWHGLSIPTLVLINGSDPMHPAGSGERLAAGIPGSRLVEIASKEKDPALHAFEARKAIESFVSSLEDR